MEYIFMHYVQFEFTGWLAAVTLVLINMSVHCCNLISVQKAVKPVTLSSLLHIRHLKEMEAAGVKLLETCPYCGFADIPSKDDEVFCCLNLDCMRETCRWLTFFAWYNAAIKDRSILSWNIRWSWVINYMLTLLDCSVLHTYTKDW